VKTAATVRTLTPSREFVNAIVAVRRREAAPSELSRVAQTKIQAAVERVRKADQAATDARRKLRNLMRSEIAAGRATKASIARELGVSRQRVQKMLEESGR